MRTEGRHRSGRRAARRRARGAPAPPMPRAKMRDRLRRHRQRRDRCTSSPRSSAPRRRGSTSSSPTFKSEDLAAQAVVGGQADVGVGTPYALIQKVKAPIRIFFQLSTLRFYPVVNAEYLQGAGRTSNGQEIAVHSRGSGTEAIMRLMADKHGITYSRHQLRAGLGGARRRAAAGHRQGVDRRRRRTSACSRRRRPASSPFLPTRRASAPPTRRCSPTRDFLKANAADVDILVEAMLHDLARDRGQSGGRSSSCAAKYKLLPDLPADMERGILPYFREMADRQGAAAQRRRRGGGEDDLAFYSLAGQLAGRSGEPEGRGLLGPRPARRACSRKLGTAEPVRSRDADAAELGEAAGAVPVPARAARTRAVFGGHPIALASSCRSASSSSPGRSPGASRSTSPSRPSRRRFVAFVADDRRRQPAAGLSSRPCSRC